MRKISKNILLFSSSVLASLALTASPILADEPVSTMIADAEINETDVFPSAFFDQYSPQTALDMIERLPGFAFDSGTDVRGFGAASGNVLINGVRPTSKSVGVTGGIESALIRIPADQVERIEILRGGESGSEALGQTIVANVVRVKGGSSGTWRTSAVHEGGTGMVTPRLELSLARTFGDWETTFDINTGTRDWLRTAVIPTYDADDQLRDTKDETFTIFAKWFRISADASRPLAGGKLSLNGRLDLTKRTRDIERLGYVGRDIDAGPHDNIWHYNKPDIERNGEVGADWSRTYDNDWKWRLIGLYVLDKPKDHSETVFQNFLVASEKRKSFVANQTRRSFIENKTKSELILRTTYGKNGSAKLKPEFGIEFARNKLDNRASATRNGVPIALNLGNVTVSESRGEAFAAMTYQATSDLVLNSGLTLELSKIKVVGNTSRSQSLNFLKPRLSATYSFNDRTRLTVKLERIVGQLDFNDFAASSQAADDRITSGNPDLVPDKKYVASTSLDWTFGERGSLNIEAFYEARRDILEEIILPSGGYGLGNAGNARYWGVTSRANLPLDSFIKGGLLKLSFGLKDSSFADPIIGGEKRRINNMKPYELSVDFRHDIVDDEWAWGVRYERNGARQHFFSNVIRELRDERRLSAFVETTRFFGVKMALKAEQLNSGRYGRDSYFFGGDRSGPLTGREISKRKKLPLFRFEVSRSF